MKKPTKVKACQCGAVEVVFDDGITNHMRRDTFDRLFPGVGMTDSRPYYNCDHCVNHWGIDLCGCGSGEPVGECCEKFAECESGTASEKLGAVTQRSMWAH